MSSIFDIPIYVTEALQPWQWAIVDNALLRNAKREVSEAFEKRLSDLILYGRPIKQGAEMKWFDDAEVKKTIDSENAEAEKLDRKLVRATQHIAEKVRTVEKLELKVKSLEEKDAKRTKRYVDTAFELAQYKLRDAELELGECPTAPVLCPRCGQTGKFEPAYRPALEPRKITSGPAMYSSLFWMLSNEAADYAPDSVAEGSPERVVWTCECGYNFVTRPLESA